MNPEKLFDYLDGNLPAREHAELEERLATDPQLQRELALAQEMHRRGRRGAREVLGESDELEVPPPSGKLGRRLAAAFALLVLVVILPVIGVYLLTLFDIAFRIDIGWAKLFWGAGVLFTPVIGLIAYWLLRPKNFNPIYETQEPSIVVWLETPLEPERSIEQRRAA